MKFTTGKYKGLIIGECNDYSYLCMVKQHSGWKHFTRVQMKAVDQRVTELIHQKWVERGMGEMVDGEFEFFPPEKTSWDRDEVKEKMMDTALAILTHYTENNLTLRGFDTNKWIDENLSK